MEEKIENRFRGVERSKTFKNIVATFGLDKKAVLDIGCSYGEFLPHFGEGSLGVTIDKEEAEYARKRGLDVVCGNIETQDVCTDRRFDAIFANNIIGHLYSPHNFLIKIKECLKDNGFVIIGAPCIPKLAWLLRFGKFQGSLASSHINFFSKETLVKTVERAGYIVLETRGFRFRGRVMEWLLGFIYPHFYVVAVPQKGFEYSEKRQKELLGYLPI